MPEETRDSGTPQAADAAEPQLVDLALLLDSPKKPTDAPDDTEAEAGDDLSQLAEHDAPIEDDDETDEDEAQEPEEDEAETDEDNTEDDEDEAAEDKSQNARQQHAFDKLVKKEKAKRHEMAEALETKDAEIERLRAENAALVNDRPEPEDTSVPPMLAKATTEAEVRQVESNAKRTVKFAEANLELLRYKPDEVEAAIRAEGATLPEFTEEAMAKWLLRVKHNAGDVLDSVPGRMQRFARQSQFAVTERKFSAEAERLIPWLKVPKSPEMAAFNAVVADMPEIKRRPNWKALVAAHVEGLKVIRARAQKATAATTRLKAKPPARSNNEPAPVNDPKAARRRAAFSKVMAGEGRLEDIAHALG